MAPSRASRIILDIAIDSVKYLQPTVSKLWGLTKNMVSSTPAKLLVVNPVVSKVESTLSHLTGVLVSKLSTLRDQYLPKEEKYLMSELEKVRKRKESTQGGGGQSGC